MTNNKYTTNTIVELENFFQERFSISCIKTGQYGRQEGVKYISYAALNGEQQNELDEFSRSKFGLKFKDLQSKINVRIKRGKLKLPSDEPETPETTDNTETVNVIVKCSRLVRDNKMSESELSEIINNLYS